MRKILLLALLFAYSTLGYGQPKNFQIGSISPSDYYSTIKYENVEGLLIVNVEIGGKIRRFMFDTGASCMVTKTLYSELAPVTIDSIPISDVNKNKAQLAIVQLDSLRLGEVSFYNIPTMVCDTLSFPVFSCLDVEGVIGSNLFYNSIIRISSIDSTLTITGNKNNLKLNKKYASKLATNTLQNFPLVWIYLDGKKGRLSRGRELVLFDSGYANGVYDMSISTYNFFLERRKHMLSLLDEQKSGKHIYGFFGTGTDTTLHQLGLKQLRIGKVPVNNLVTYSTVGGSKLGSKILDYGIVTIDYINKKFYFEPISENPIEMGVTKETNFSSAYENGKVIVSTVWGSALATQLTPGDEILEINGYSCENISFCDLFFLNSKTSHKNSETLILTIRNAQGEIKKVEVVKKTYQQLLDEKKN